MNTYANQALKTGNDFKNNEPRAPQRTLKLTVYDGKNRRELLPKEIICCIMATD